MGMSDVETNDIVKDATLARATNGEIVSQLVKIDEVKLPYVIRLAYRALSDNGIHPSEIFSWQTRMGLVQKAENAEHFNFGSGDSYTSPPRNLVEQYQIIFRLEGGRKATVVILREEMTVGDWTVTAVQIVSKKSAI